MDATREAAQRAVQELAAHYRAKADAVARAGVVTGATLGLFVGVVPLTPLRFAWPIPGQYGYATALMGLGIGILIGYVIGDGRAQLYRRMAEQARLQLRLEDRLSANDQRIAALVAELQNVRAAEPPEELDAPPVQKVPHLTVAPPLTPPVST
jgi:hypothetical protein